MRPGTFRPGSSTRVGLAALVAGALVTAGLGVGVAPAAAAAAERAPVALLDAPRVVTLRAPSSAPVRPGAAQQRRLGRTAAATRPAVSQWEVTYTGFESNPAARQAFQAAVDIWAGLVASDVPIKVSATYKDLGDPNVLGQAGPTDFAVPDDRTAYPVALANALLGYDVSTPSSRSSGNDIDAEFNNRAGNVYYGTDGVVPRGFVDFESVVLHELGHGLGLLGSMDVDDAKRGSYGAGTPYPAIFDRFAVLSQGSVQGKSLLSYPNRSTSLGTALTSGAVYWDGALGKAAYNGRPPRLYTPSTYEPASSFSHLDDKDFPTGDRNALMTPFVENDEVIHDPGPVVLGMFADMGWGTPQPDGVRYTPVDPERILDTRSGLGAPVRRLGAGSFLDLAVVGRAGVPTDAQAVVLNLTGVGASEATDLRAYPTPRTGSAQPLVSNLNLAAGDIRANLITVPLGENGRVRILNRGGSVHVLADVLGWYGATASSTYHPVNPVRLLDTRDSSGSGPLAGGTPRDLVVTGGAAGVPASATAVILTVTALRANSTTDVRVYPTPADASGPPQVSNLNLAPPGIVPNLVITKVGANGSVRLLNNAGQVDVIVDLAGWFDTETGALFHVLAPKRVLDTRTTSTPRVFAGESRDLPLLGVAGVARSAVAAVLNVTGVSATRTTDVAVYPRPSDESFAPLVSSLNLLRGQTNADLVVSPLGAGGQVRLRNSGGDISLVADVAGWFGP